MFLLLIMVIKSFAVSWNTAELPLLISLLVLGLGDVFQKYGIILLVSQIVLLEFLCSQLSVLDREWETGGSVFSWGALPILFPLAETRSLLFKQMAVRLPFKQRVRKCSISWSWFTFPAGTQRSTEEHDVQELGTRHKAGSSEVYQERHCIGNWLLNVFVHYINQSFSKILK